MSTRIGIPKSNPVTSTGNDTFVLLKPDATKKQLLVELLLRLRVMKLRVVELRSLMLSASDVDFLYLQHQSRPSYQPMKKWLQTGPCIALHVTGRSAVNKVRTMMGTGNFPYPVRTFRGQYGTTQWKNAMHASDSPETAEMELERFLSSM